MVTIEVSSRERTELIDITGLAAAEVTKNGFQDGFLMLFIPHTTAGITLNEGADPSVKSDILMLVNKVIPWQDAYRHSEGNSPAHIKTSLMGSSALVMVEKGKIMLGTWQSIFFCEFDGPRKRKVHLKFLGQSK